MTACYLNHDRTSDTECVGCLKDEIERLRAFYNEAVRTIERLRATLGTLADIGEGSKTLNSLPHIAKIARAAAEK